MQVGTTIMTESPKYLLNVTENSKEVVTEQLFQRTGSKPGKTNNYSISMLFGNGFGNNIRDPLKMVNAQASAEIINQAKKVVNGKKVKKSNVIPNEQTDLVDARPDIVCGSSKKSNTSQNEQQEEFAQMDTETTVDGSKKLPNDNGDTAVTKPKPFVNGSKVKSMPLKEQPDILCNCPLQCNNKLSIQWRKGLYEEFHGIENHGIQNLFIQRHMKIRSMVNGLRKDKVVDDKKTQKRVNCKYLVPISGTVKDSLSYAKRLSYDWAKSSRRLRDRENGKESSSASKPSAKDDTTKEIQTDSFSTPTNTLPSLNGYHDSVPETRKAETYDTSSLMSLDDSDSVNTSLDDVKSGSEGESQSVTPVNYIEVCQKAFVNTFGLTEKRIRWQREKLIFKAKSYDIKKQKEREESDRTLTLAHSLGVGCQPLFALLEKTNSLHLCNVLLDAIGQDVALVNQFFKNQLWKPEYILDGPLNEANSAFMETDCDEIF